MQHHFLAHTIIFLLIINDTSNDYVKWTIISLLEALEY